MIRRYALAALIVLVAVLCAPAAAAPGFNSADMIVVAAPLILVAVLLRRPTPAGDSASPLPTTTPQVASPAGSHSGGDL